MNITLFPVDLVRSRILGLLSLKDLVNLDQSYASHSDRQLFRAAYSELLVQEEVLMNDAVLGWLDARKITPTRVAFLQSVVERPMTVVRSAQEIRFGASCQLSAPIIMSILGNSMYLQALTMEGHSELTDEMVSHFSSTCVHLHSIYLLDHQNITDLSLRALATNCTKLCSVGIPYCRKISDEGIGFLFSRCRHLKHLNITACPQLTNASLLAIAAHATQLTTLHMSFLEHTTHDVAVQLWDALPGLTSVDLSFCIGLTEDTLLQLVRKCRGLQCLLLEIYPQLTNHAVQEIAKHCSNLRTISVAKSSITQASVTALVTQCPLLRRLRMDSCPTIDDVAILTVAHHCPHLVELDIAGCTQVREPATLTALVCSCPMLENLRVGVVQGAVTDQLLDLLPEHCPRLQHLSMFWCYKVTDEATQRLQQHFGKQLSVVLPGKTPVLFV